MANADPEEITRGLRLYHPAPDDIFEIRAFPRHGVASGYFTGHNIDAAAAAAAELSGKCPGVYVTINPLLPQVLEDARNNDGKIITCDGKRIKLRYPGIGLIKHKVNTTTADSGVARLRWLPLDIDPERPPETAATDEQKAAAVALAADVRETLEWPAPVEVDSGNGYYLLAAIDLPRDAHQLVAQALVGLAKRFNTPQAHIDIGVGNPSRILRIPGTLNAKGKPYRPARIVVATAEFEQLSRDHITALGEPPPRRGRQPIVKWSNVEPQFADRIIKTKEQANGLTLHVIKGCPFNAHDHGRAGFFMVAADGRAFPRCLNSHCTGKGLREFLDANPEVHAEEGKGKQSAAVRLIELAEEIIVDSFHDAREQPYVTVRHPAGHHETHILPSKNLKRLLAHNLHRASGITANSFAYNDAFNVLEGHALYDGPQREVYYRYGRSADGTVTYIDRGAEDWQIVEISARGWRLIDYADCPVPFRRSPPMLTLPAPVQVPKQERAAVLEELWGYVNVLEALRPLYLGILLGDMRVAPQYVLAFFVGTKHGGGKSTQTRIMQRLIDPSDDDIRETTRDRRDWVAAAWNSHFCARDNVSLMPPYFSDFLCRLATGGGQGGRTLFTNTDQTVFKAKRPAALTSIVDVVTEADLLDRGVFLLLDEIADHPSHSNNGTRVIQRIDEETLWPAFEQLTPRVLGVLYDALAYGLSQIATVKLQESFRMLDFARWACACLPALGVTAEQFLSAYKTNRARGKTVALEESPIYAPLYTHVYKMIDKGESHEYSPTALYQVLMAQLDDRTARNFPATPATFSKGLKRLAPALSSIGIEVKVGDKSNGDRGIALTHCKEGLPKMDFMVNI